MSSRVYGQAIQFLCWNSLGELEPQWQQIIHPIHRILFGKRVTAEDLLKPCERIAKAHGYGGLTFGSWTLVYSFKSECLTILLSGCEIGQASLEIPVYYNREYRRICVEE
jgi:hypothetical protein